MPTSIVGHTFVGISIRKGGTGRARRDTKHDDDGMVVRHFHYALTYKRTVCTLVMQKKDNSDREIPCIAHNSGSQPQSLLALISPPTRRPPRGADFAAKSGRKLPPSWRRVGSVPHFEEMSMPKLLRLAGGRVALMGIVLLTFGALASTARAADPIDPSHDIRGGDTAWMLISAALVMLMVPGLALFYGGMVHARISSAP
jgi:hypothetical protein